MSGLDNGLLRRHARQLWWAALLRQPLRGAPAVAATLLSAGAIVVIGAVGGRGGESLAIFYVIPPLACTVLVDRDVGLVLSAEAAIVWALVSPPIPAGGGRLAVDAVLRFLVVSLAVCLVSGLRRAVAHARRSDERSREFLALAAHQLRNPLAGMRTSAEAVVARGAGADQEALLANIVREADRVSRLVTTLLEMSRIDLQDAIPTAPVDLVPLCGEAVAKAAMSGPQLELRFEGAEAQVVARTNAEAVRHILGNLLGNATRHARTAVELTCFVDGGTVGIRVTDDGPGLPPGTEERAFDAFVSLDGAGGSGLGLALSRGLARKLEGELCYDAGAFVLSLPVPAPLPASAVRRFLSARPAAGH
jgi:signal transduction histidine kinase